MGRLGVFYEFVTGVLSMTAAFNWFWIEALWGHSGLDLSEVVKSTMSSSIASLTQLVEIRISKSLSIIPFAIISVHVLSAGGKSILLAVDFWIQDKMFF